MRFMIMEAKPTQYAVYDHGTTIPACFMRWTSSGVPWQAPGGNSGDRRRHEDMYDGIRRWHGSDVQNGERPGWPHQSVGVSGLAHRVQSQAPEGYSGDRRPSRHEDMYDGVPNRHGSSAQYSERPGWPHQSVGVPVPARRVSAFDGGAQA